MLIAHIYGALSEAQHPIRGAISLSRFLWEQNQLTCLAKVPFLILSQSLVAQSDPVNASQEAAEVKRFTWF